MAADTRSDLRLAIESVLFVAHSPVDVATLARVAEVSEADVDEALRTIAADYKGKGLRIQRTETAAQFVSAPEAAPFVQSFLGIDESQTISPAVLETLAIIAYKQPIARSTIERIRGVNCDYAVAVLKARSLITEVGRAASPGRPYLYGTTFRFLEHFGLENPEDLPPLPELDSVVGSDPVEVLPIRGADQPPFDAEPGPSDEPVDDLVQDESDELDEATEHEPSVVVADDIDESEADEPALDDSDDAPPWE